MRRSLKICTTCGTAIKGKGLCGLHFCRNCKTVIYVSRYNEKKMCTTIRTFALSKKAEYLTHNSALHLE